MRNKTYFAVLALVLVLVAGFAVAPVAGAQDEMGVVCDADLILSLYTAEYYFGFAAVNDMMSAEMMVDTAMIDKGQYAPLFDAMMGMMDENMMMPGMMTEADMQAITDQMMQSADMMMEETPAADMMMTELAPLAIEGEAAECSTLRAHLHAFYDALATHNMMMSENM